MEPQQPHQSLYDLRKIDRWKHFLFFSFVGEKICYMQTWVRFNYPFRSLLASGQTRSGWWQTHGERDRRRHNKENNDSIVESSFLFSFFLSFFLSYFLSFFLFTLLSWKVRSSSYKQMCPHPPEIFCLFACFLSSLCIFIKQ